MALDLKFVKLRIVKGAEFRRKTPKLTTSGARWYLHIARKLIGPIPLIGRIN